LVSFFLKKVKIMLFCVALGIALLLSYFELLDFLPFGEFTAL